MKTFNARVAIYCDVEIEVPDTFDPNNFEAEELDKLLDQALENSPELYDTKAGRAYPADAYEVLSIWDWDTDTYIFEG